MVLSDWPEVTRDNIDMENIILNIYEENPRRPHSILDYITTVETIPLEMPDGDYCKWWGVEVGRNRQRVWMFRDNDNMDDYRGGQEVRRMTDTGSGNLMQDSPTGGDIEDGIDAIRAFILEHR